MEHNAGESPLLIGERGPLRGERFPVQGEVLIGREPDCTIVIPDRQVSRHHARLWVDAQGVWLEDLASKNGTHVNGRRVEAPVQLQDGDLVQIALAQQFLFLSSDATMPLTPVEAPPLARGRLQLDSRARRVWIGGQEVRPPLSVAQFRLLELLYEHQGEVVSRQALMQGIWEVEGGAGVTDQALDALVRRLRERLAEVDPEHNYVVTVRGHGLRLDNPLD